MKILVFALLFVGINSFAGPRNVGNGGGGIVRDGVYMTFGSAGIVIDPEPVPMALIPGLDLTVKSFRSLKISEASELQALVLPFGARKYFNVVKEKFSEEKYRSLREEYAKVANVPADSITIFALTNPETRETFLLPEFFGLKQVEQAAILFHEAYWIKKTSATYQEVVKAEVAFQKYMEAREKGFYEPALADRLADLFEDRSLSLNMHLQQDLASGALSALGADSQNGVPVWTFMEPRLHCDNHSDYHRGYARGAVVASGFQLEYSYDLALKYPQSFFLRAVVDFLSPDSQGHRALLLMGLSEKQINALEDRDPRGQCFPYLEPMNLRFVKVVTVDGRLSLEQQWIKPASESKYEKSTSNGDGSVTLQNPFFMFKGIKMPVVGELKRGSDTIKNNFLGVCRYLGFSQYVNDSKRVWAIHKETDAAMFDDDGAVQGVARYTNLYWSGTRDKIDFMLTEITCK